MGDLSGRGFGLLIAFVIPGFAVLWALQSYSPVVQTWLEQGRVADTAPSIGGFLYATLASIGVGITLSGARWLTVDQLHAHTGIKKPTWDDALLERRLDGFNQIVEFYYRYYQAYANGLVALALVVLVHGRTNWSKGELWLSAATAVVFFLSSRDALRRCYSKVALLLNDNRGAQMTNGGPQNSMTNDSKKAKKKPNPESEKAKTTSESNTDEK